MINILFYFYSFLIPFQEYSISVAEHLKINPSLAIPYFFIIKNKYIKINKNQIFLFFFFFFSLLLPKFIITKQLILFLFLSIPIFFIRLEEKNMKYILSGLRDIAFILSFLVFAEIIVQLIFGVDNFINFKKLYTYDLKETTNILNFSRKFLGLHRPTTFFAEPSHLGLCLNFLVLIVDKSLLINKKLTLKILLSLSIFLTGSLSAIFVLMGYTTSKFAFTLISQFKNDYKNSRISKKTINFLTYFLLSVCINSTLIIKFFFTRIKQVFSSFNSNGILIGSESERINAIFMIFKLEFPHNLFGYGLGETLEFTKNLTFNENYMSGKIPNILTNLVISLGLVGTLFFLFSIFGIIICTSNEIDLSIFVFLLLMSFSIGNFYNSYLWAPLFILINTLNSNYLIKNKNII